MLLPRIYLTVREYGLNNFFLFCFKTLLFLATYATIQMQAYQIDTLATRLGVKRIAKGATACLILNYVHAILTGLVSKSASELFGPSMK